jgi:hypothetical protein
LTTKQPDSSAVIALVDADGDHRPGAAGRLADRVRRRTGNLDGLPDEQHVVGPGCDRRLDEREVRVVRNDGLRKHDNLGPEGTRLVDEPAHLRGGALPIEQDGTELHCGCSYLSFRAHVLLGDRALRASTY